PGGGFVLRGEVEGTGMPVPTTQRLLGCRMMTTGRIQKGRGARPPIEVLVGTPHGEVDIAVRQIHRYRTRTVAQIPHHQCTVLVRSEEHTSELQSRFDLVCRLLLEKKKPR